MKIRKSIKNLSLNKQTVANLNRKEANGIRGGVGLTNDDPTCDGMHTCVILVGPMTRKMGLKKCIG